MSLKHFYTDFKEISKNNLVRFNFQTLNISKFLLPKIKTFKRLKYFFFIKNGFAFKSKNYLDCGIRLLRINDLEDTSDREQVFLGRDFKLKYKDYLSFKNDILISLTGDGFPRLKLIEGENFLINQRIGILRKIKKLNEKFFFYLFRNSFFQKQFLYFCAGKTQKNISSFDILNIKIPLISKELQDNIVNEEILPLENQIKKLKEKMIDEKVIINEVFAEEFNFDLEKFEELKKEKFFYLDFKEFSKHKDLRNGISVVKRKIDLKSLVKKDYSYVNCNKIFTLEYGEGLKEEERIEGQFPIVGSNGIIGYHNQYLIKGPSLIVGRKGSVGKVNYLEKDNFPIDTCFYVKFKTKENLNYYLYLLKFLNLSQLTLFKAVPGLNRNDVYSLKIPNLPLKDQERISNKIKKQIDKQQEMKKEIEEKTNKIDGVIEKIIEKNSL